VLAATNHPWDVDPALLRPGRLDRSMLVLPPDRAARTAILVTHLRGRPVANLDLDAVAKATDGWSGADLRLLCEDAASRALGDAVASGSVRPITQKDLRAARRAIRPTMSEWFAQARNAAQFSNEGGLYDELLDYMRERRML